MNRKAERRANLAARRLRNEAGAMHAITIVADISKVVGGENHILLGQDGCTPQLVAAILSAIVKKLGQAANIQAPKMPITVGQ